MRGKVERVAKWGGLVAALAAVYGIARAFIPDALGATVSSAPPVPAVAAQCTTACSGAGLRVGQSIVVYKSASTARTSTVVTAVDPDLQVTSLPAGTYEVRLYAYVWNTTTNTQGFKFTFSSGGMTSARGVCVAATGAAGGLTGGLVDGSVATNLAGLTVDSDLGMQCDLAGILGTPFTVAIYWSQSSSSANSTILRSGHMIVTRIS